jgi:hypothetical protein
MTVLQAVKPNEPVAKPKNATKRRLRLTKRVEDFMMNAYRLLLMNLSMPSTAEMAFELIS